MFKSQSSLVFGCLRRWTETGTSFVLELQKTELDHKRPKTAGFCSLWTGLGLNWLKTGFFLPKYVKYFKNINQ